MPKKRVSKSFRLLMSWLNIILRLILTKSSAPQPNPFLLWFQLKTPFAMYPKHSLHGVLTWECFSVISSSRIFTFYEPFVAGCGWQCEAALDECFLWSNVVRFMFLLHLSSSHSSEGMDVQHDIYKSHKNYTVLSCSEMTKFSWNEGQNTNHF